MTCFNPLVTLNVKQNCGVDVHSQAHAAFPDSALLMSYYSLLRYCGLANIDMSKEMAAL